MTDIVSFAVDPFALLKSPNVIKEVELAAFMMVFPSLSHL